MQYKPHADVNINNNHIKTFKFTEKKAGKIRELTFFSLKRRESANDMLWNDGEYSFSKTKVLLKLFFLVYMFL